ncbi:hypothetical protein A2W14_02550 [Candidatus Gottesmanbacteria bacterium RBG_16_37_8]|uniref:Ribbon-helix-helix protein CopG domain-containing protein n=1 Tax=Candidatus Gottesmanbacteria bacterium RBG_16_37_8 TaxID=1798371 RepID=A0A1F5YPW4_9BACT|nr:MAG: hypothetical protein A2W14_02550 [Candidatus Gottesmanbacteria bacterium RBG_16_37_8]
MQTYLGNLWNPDTTNIEILEKLGNPITPLIKLSLTIDCQFSNILIHMLTKRTNILFEENVFRALSAMAAKKGTSIGDLVRLAITKVYFKENHAQRIAAYNKILTIRKTIRYISSSDIKDFIDYGRKN